MLTRLIFLACLAATLFMTGVIWFVEVVHYPLLSRVGADPFPAYHAQHTRLTGRVVLIPMVVELLTSAWLVWDRPRGFGPVLAWAGLVAALATWGITFFCSVPAHNRLSLGFDPTWHRWLVATNRYRALAWTAHAVILLIATSRQID